MFTSSRALDPLVVFKWDFFLACQGYIFKENLWFANIIIGPAVLESIDPNQFGAIPNSSTLHALISMMHLWVQTMDGTSSAVRVICSDYRKAFDLVDL